MNLDFKSFYFDLIFRQDKKKGKTEMKKYYDCENFFFFQISGIPNQSSFQFI